MDPLFIPEPSERVRGRRDDVPRMRLVGVAPRTEFNSEMNYVHTGHNRPIRVYERIDQRFILEDFFAKLARFTRKS